MILLFLNDPQVSPNELDGGEENGLSQLLKAGIFEIKHKSP